MSISRINSDQFSVVVGHALWSNKTTTFADVEPPKEKLGRFKKRVQKPSKLKKKYFTSSERVTSETRRFLDKEKSPFSFPDDLEMFSYKIQRKTYSNDIRKKELKMPCSSKPSYIMREKKDLLNRLFVNEPPITSMKTKLTDYPLYYTEIENRPIPDSFQKTQYISNLRDVLRLKIQTGYLEDEAMLIKEKLEVEQNKVDTITENFNQYVDTFERVLLKDYTESMSKLEKVDTLAIESDKKYEEYKQLSKDYGSLRSTVFKLEDQWSACKIYRNFLYMLSPNSWKTEKQQSAIAELNYNEIFKTSTMVDLDSLSNPDILDSFDLELEEAKNPQLYFTEPGQLIEIFRFMEIQNLDTLLHTEELSESISILNERIQSAELIFNAEIHLLEEGIEKLTSRISFVQNVRQMSFGKIDSSDLIDSQYVGQQQMWSVSVSATTVEPAILSKKTFKKIKYVKPQKKQLSKYYFTASQRVNESNQRLLHKEKSPFKYPKDLEIFTYKVMTKAYRNDIRRRDLSLPCTKKPNHRLRQKEDLLNRLFVKEPEITSLRTKTDEDPCYYSLIEGRPIPDKLNVKDYVQILRDNLRMRVVAGYRADKIMSIKEKLNMEQEAINDVNKHFTQCKKAFEDFLYCDYVESMKLLEEAENLQLVIEEEFNESVKLKKQFGTLRSSLYKLEEQWRECKNLQHFLHTTSPVAWKSIYKASFVGFKRYTEIVRSKLVNASLVDLIENFDLDCIEEEAPKLYFTSPDQLIDIFRYLEVQNLNSLLHTEELAVPLAIVKDQVKDAKVAFSKEIKYLEELVEKTEGDIKWEEDRAKYLEELSRKLIEEDFKELMTNEDILNLQVFVEDVYESQIGVNDANLSIAEMMKAVEVSYRKELLKLDKLPREQVAALEVNYYEKQNLIMKLAEKAAKQFVVLEKLTYKLNKALEPPFVKTGKELKKRSPPINPPKPIPVPPRQLTNDEIDYLQFFTDYCEETDKLIDFGIDLSSQPADNDEGKSIKSNIFEIHDSKTSRESSRKKNGK